MVKFHFINQFDFPYNKGLRFQTDSKVSPNKFSLAVFLFKQSEFYLINSRSGGYFCFWIFFFCRGYLTPLILLRTINRCNRLINFIIFLFFIVLNGY